MSAVEFDKRKYSTDSEYMIQNLKEKKNLEKWQKLLCQAVNVFACFVDCDGTPLTALSGNPDEATRLMKAIDQEQLQNMLARVCESTLEDQAIEETGYSNLRMAVITARAFGRPVLNWVIFGVLSDDFEEEGEKLRLLGFESMITARAFNRVIDAISEFSRDLVSSAAHTLNAEAESRRSQYSAKALEANLKRTEALAEIIQLLENDDAIEKLMLRILRTVGSFLNLSTAALCRNARQTGEIDILSHWCNQKEVWGLEADAAQKKPFFIKDDEKAYILSDTSGLTKEEREELEARDSCTFGHSGHDPWKSRYVRRFHGEERKQDLAEVRDQIPVRFHEDPSEYPDKKDPEELSGRFLCLSGDDPRQCRRCCVCQRF